MTIENMRKIVDSQGGFTSLELARVILSLDTRLTDHIAQEWLNKRKLPFDTGPVLNDAKPTPTDEELVEKLITEYLFLFNARFDMDVKDSEDVRDILRQLIEDVKR